MDRSNKDAIIKTFINKLWGDCRAFSYINKMHYFYFEYNQYLFCCVIEKKGSLRCLENN